MIDANQSRFLLVLGQTDWGRFRSPAGVLSSDPGKKQTASSDPSSWPLLSDLWKDPSVSHRIAWSERSQGVVLTPSTLGFKKPLHDAPPDLDSRGASAIDGFGNIYHVAVGGASIEVTNSGDGTTTRFWPNPPALF